MAAFFVCVITKEYRILKEIPLLTINPLVGVYALP